MIAWPLYRVIVKAPVIDTNVPMDLARVLLVFQSNFSILYPQFTKRISLKIN